MEAFAALLDRLYYTSSNLGKAELVKDYLRKTPDPDRGWAVAAIAGTLSFDLFKHHLLKTLITERMDSYLFDLSYDYVGEMSETVAHLWPVSNAPTRLNRLPSLSELIERFQQSDKEQTRQYLIDLLDNMDARQRWALAKLGTRSLRIGISARFLKKILADYGNRPVEEIEALWHGLEPPYTDLLAWLDGSADKPDVSERITFHPVMLSHPFEQSENTAFSPDDWQVEWKYDGIRVQLVSTERGNALFSRTGDDISHSFPDLLARLQAQAVLDGELLVMHGQQVAPFNDLQQRLNKKAPGKKLMETHPAGMIVYDALALDGEKLTQLPLAQRRKRLESWLDLHKPEKIYLSEVLCFQTMSDLEALRESAAQGPENYIEGIMIKRKGSHYVPGRPSGQWYKYKRDPLLVDAVIMYAQRGHGKRSSFYSDYTFGLWEGDQLLPIGKAYSGFTDEELKALDKWVRNHTTARFGPVREVEKSLVFEVAFDSVHASPRHKSGLALRFPRIHRIRWDKPASEADLLSSLKAKIA